MTTREDSTDRSGPDRRSGIAAQLSKGAFTLLGSMAVVRALGIISVAILGRLLTPEDFGIVALASFVTGLFNQILARHFENVLIRTPDATAQHVGSAFTLSVTWGVVTSALAFLSAQPIADLLDEPAVASALTWLALVPLLDGLRNPGFVLYEKNLRFGWPALQEVTVRFSVLIVSVSVALIYKNYWAIVCGLITYSFVRALLSHVLTPTPLRPNLRHCREFIAMGGWMTGSAVITFLRERIDRVMLGAQLGTGITGHYRMGDDMASLATQQVATMLGRVIYPGLSHRSESEVTLRRVYIKAQSVVLGLLLPIGVLTAITAPDLLRVVVGPQWVDAAPVLMVLAPCYALNSMVAGVRAIILIRGDTRTLFLRDVVMLVIALPLLWIGIQYGGFEGLIAAKGAITLVLLGITLWLATHVINAPWYAPIKASWRTCVAAMAMVVIGSQFKPLLPEGGEFGDALYRLVATCTVCMTAYLTTHIAIWYATGKPKSAERDIVKLIAERASRFRRRGESF